jgi:hypothetical protein
MCTQLFVLQVAVALLVQLPLPVIITFDVGCKIKKPALIITPCENKKIGEISKNVKIIFFDILI